MPDISRPERAELHRTVRAFFDRHSGDDQVRRLLDEDRDFAPEVWARIGDQLGLPALLVPESLDGQGFSPQEAVLGLEEAGRRLSGVPLLSSSVVATWALLQAMRTKNDSADATGDGSVGTAVDDIAPLLSHLAANRRIAALCAENPVTVRSGPTGWLADGVTTNVVGGHLADTLLVFAEGFDNPRTTGLFAVDANGAGAAVEYLPTLDLTRPVTRVTFTGAQARRLHGDFAEGLTSTRALAAVGASAELLGVAEQSLSLAVEYARTREQFGVRIGTFQAVKHLLADTLADVEQMRAVVATAAAAFSDAPDQAAELASLAKAFCSDAGPRAVESLIQVLGGTGFTWEHVAHLYLRRAKTLEFLFGDAAFHREELAVRLGLTA